MVSINKLALGLVEKFIKDPDYYRVAIEKLPSGATVIDTGLRARTPSTSTSYTTSRAR
jgi:methenyltetrahydromethanopterin cyclohydrolase